MQIPKEVIVAIENIKVPFNSQERSKIVSMTAKKYKISRNEVHRIWKESGQLEGIKVSRLKLHKLTMAEIEEIKKMEAPEARFEKGAFYKKIADKYNVLPSSIRTILTGPTTQESEIRWRKTIPKEITEKNAIELIRKAYFTVYNKYPFRIIYKDAFHCLSIVLVHTERDKLERPDISYIQLEETIAFNRENFIKAVLRSIDYDKYKKSDAYKKAEEHQRKWEL